VDVYRSRDDTRAANTKIFIFKNLNGQTAWKASSTFRLVFKKKMCLNKEKEKKEQSLTKILLSLIRK